ASLLALPPALTPLSPRVEPRSPAGRASLAAIEQASILPRRLGRYHLFAHIGRGGMADIYLAQAETALGDARRLVVVNEVLRGLSFAHRARDEEGRPLGIVHRDVSPSNVLLSFEGEVKVCDFGIARAHALAGELPEETIAGKAGYMSPEQARGESLDARADVFAAGIILWEMLAGRRLYK